MKVDKVGVSLVYSEGTKSVEIKAEGVPDSRETWQQAVVTLNNQLSLTMKSIWGKLPDDDLLPEEWEVPQAPGSFPTKQPQAQSSFPPDHWCQEHRVDWKKRTNNQTGEEWWSHRNADKSWCRQPA